MDEGPEPTLDTRARRPGAGILPSGKLTAMAIAPLADLVSIQRGPETFLEQFRQVTRPQGWLYAVSWCQSEVRDGGFRQLFSKRTGVLAPEAVEGFRFLRAPKLVEIVSEAMASFGPDYPRGHEERQAALPPGQSRFDALDKAYFGELERLGGFDEMTDAFVRAHMDKFFKDR